MEVARPVRGADRRNGPAEMLALRSGPTPLTSRIAYPLSLLWSLPRFTQVSVAGAGGFSNTF
jgi:hypothetical protein